MKSRAELPEIDIRIIAACSQGAIGKAVHLVSEPDFMAERHTVLQELNKWISGPSILSISTAESFRAIAEPRKNDPDTRTRIRRLTDILNHVLSWYSDLMALKARGEKAVITNCDYRSDLDTQVHSFSIGCLAIALRSIMDTCRYLEGNITPQLALECMLFDLRPDRG